MTEEGDAEAEEDVVEDNEVFIDPRDLMNGVDLDDL